VAAAGEPGDGEQRGENLQLSDRRPGRAAAVIVGVKLVVEHETGRGRSSSLAGHRPPPSGSSPSTRATPATRPPPRARPADRARTSSRNARRLRRVVRPTPRAIANTGPLDALDASVGRRQVSSGVVDLGAAGAGRRPLVALARACGGTAAAGNELGDRRGELLALGVADVGLVERATIAETWPW
jgi:hypothetical protein